MYFSFYEIILAAAFITGIIRYRALDPLLRKFVLLLGLTLFMETIGWLTSVKHIRNLWIFNFFTCFEFLFYSYVFNRLLENGRWVRVIKWAMLIYLILFLLNIFFIEGFERFHTITYRIGSVMVVLCCCLYLRQLMHTPSFEPVSRNPFFWTTTGLLFFYTGFFFYMSAASILLYTKLTIDRIVWEAISGTLNIILYGSFIIAFLCQRIPKKK